MRQSELDGRKHVSGMSGDGACDHVSDGIVSSAQEREPS